MTVSFRSGFYAGLAAAVVIGAYLAWLWQPSRQVQLHNEHLLAAVEAKNWSRVGDFVDQSYQDKWGNDRALLLARLRESLRYARHLRIEQIGASTSVSDDNARWGARITVQADDNEVTALIKERVNRLDAPFFFEWRKASGKPWDWKLTRVSNDALELPEANF